MRGTHALRVQSAHLRYDLEFSRNITVIRGDSATGKTTLVDMVREWLLNGTDTGITLACDRPCKVIEGRAWQEQLAGTEESIVFVDEGNRFVSSTDFADAVRGSSNYFVIVTREALDNLPYSVTEIYGLRSSGRYGFIEPVYHEMYRIYGDLEPLGGVPDVVVTEDSNSGHEFFESLASDAGARCVSAGGSARVFPTLQGLKQGEVALVVADGAAFGSQMARVHELARTRGDVVLYLPESFEWLVLSSDMLNDPEVRRVLDDPSEHIDGVEYFSWERFFTHLLVERSEGTWLRYSKVRLNPAYLKGRCKRLIVAALPGPLREALMGGASPTEPVAYFDDPMDE